MRHESAGAFVVVGSVTTLIVTSRYYLASCLEWSTAMFDERNFTVPPTDFFLEITETATYKPATATRILVCLMETHGQSRNPSAERIGIDGIDGIGGYR